MPLSALRPTRIVSGGQTGADLAALRAGLALGYLPGDSLGGWMPRDFRNELGSRPWMKTQYGMREHRSPLYAPRTRQNVIDADVTLIFGDVRRPGSAQTVSYCSGFKKPYAENPSLEEVRALAAGKVVNVAGNRALTNPTLEAYVYRLLIEAWGDDAQVERLRPSAPWPTVWPRGGVWVPDGVEVP